MTSSNESINEHSEKKTKEIYSQPEMINLSTMSNPLVKYEYDQNFPREIEDDNCETEKSTVSESRSIHGDEVDEDELVESCNTQDKLHMEMPVSNSATIISDYPTSSYANAGCENVFNYSGSGGMINGSVNAEEMIMDPNVQIFNGGTIGSLPLPPNCNYLANSFGAAGYFYSDAELQMAAAQNYYMNQQNIYNMTAMGNNNGQNAYGMPGYLPPQFRGMQGSNINVAGPGYMYSTNGNNGENDIKPDLKTLIPGIQGLPGMGPPELHHAHLTHPFNVHGMMHHSAMQYNPSHQSLDMQIDEINTRELSQRISSELKRYSIPQAIFAQRILSRSQGTLSDLLRNPKPWSKLKSGRETFRRMWKWLQEPEFQRMSALRLAEISVNKRKEDEQSKPQDIKPVKKQRLVFTEIQRRTLMAIFQETKRPSKAMQATIAQQLGLAVSTVANFFMNARRRSVDKWQDENPHSIAMESMSQTNSPSSTGVMVATTQSAVTNNHIKCRNLSMNKDNKVHSFSKSLHNDESRVVEDLQSANPNETCENMQAELQQASQGMAESMSEMMMHNGEQNSTSCYDDNDQINMNVNLLNSQGLSQPPPLATHHHLNHLHHLYQQHLAQYPSAPMHHFPQQQGIYRQPIPQYQYQQYFPGGALLGIPFAPSMTQSANQNHPASFAFPRFASSPLSVQSHPMINQYIIENASRSGTPLESFADTFQNQSLPPQYSMNTQGVDIINKPLLIDENDCQKSDIDSGYVPIDRKKSLPNKISGKTENVVKNSDQVVDENVNESEKSYDTSIDIHISSKMERQSHSTDNESKDIPDSTSDTDKV